MVQSSREAGSAPLTREELERKIVAKAWKDPKFKEQLLQDPTKTILEEMGIDHVRDLPKFTVVEETPKNLYLVLPMSPQVMATLTEKGRLSDREMNELIRIRPLAKCAHS